ncbi:MAG: primosomal protein N' [Chlamydiota bacterium]|nr:primosomal protein N' [Chlamydiota bacterium]
MTSKQFEKYASVILEVSVDKTLEYGVPSELLSEIKRGLKVNVPLRGSLRSGYIYEVNDAPSFERVRPIASISSHEELISEEVFELATWMAKYYCSPLNKVLKTILPSSVRNNGKHKEQLYVIRKKTRDELAQYCIDIRNKHPSRAAVIDEMLKVNKGILLSELLELTGGSRSPVNTLAKDGFLDIDIVRIDRSPLVNEEYFMSKPKKLNPDQAAALEKIHASLDESRFETHLLFGVTGSGKTEVYLQAIDKAMAMGKSTIMLVPEISLTPQTVERFRSRFEGDIAILHHRLSHGERFDEWHKIREGRAKIVIGARSAIFCPIPNLGLIIVDEEHESSYKQNEEAPCYQARDVAVMRGNLSNSTVILGSATPALESYYNALNGKYTLSKLGVRADAANIPRVKIIDLKHEYEKSKGFTNFSDALLTGIKKRMEAGEQSILFLNRRGYHSVFLCKSCGESVRCQHCDVSLTYHKSASTLSCHLCGYCIRPPSSCPKCKSPETMQFKGVGTEQIEKSLYAVLPDVRIIRIDADTTKHKGSHQRLLREFGTGKADVLIGTQMIAKGLHFPQVTLVGVLNSDAALNIPDFRSSETVFQLITQVAGRSGRGSIPGEVVIQTRMPENSTIQLASKQDYESFYEEEIATRHFFGYPPFSQFVKMSFSGKDQKRTHQFACHWQNALVSSLSKDYEVHPVTTSGYAKVKDRYRYHLLVRGPAVSPISSAIRNITEKINGPSSIKTVIDVNPSSTYF